MLFALVSPLLLYPFRYFDPVRKRWIRARYLAERHVIESNYAQWEIIGPPEIRQRGNAARDSFNPFRRQSAHLPPDRETPPDHGPTPDPPPAEEPPPIEDEIERFLVLLSLRRYVTWCARKGRVGSMNLAIDLYDVVSLAPSKRRDRAAPVGPLPDSSAQPIHRARMAW